MTLNGVMDVTLRYFTEFGKPVLQQPRRSVAEFIHDSTTLLYCVYHVVVKKVHVRYLIFWWVSCSSSLLNNRPLVKWCTVRDSIVSLSQKSDLFYFELILIAFITILGYCVRPSRRKPVCSVGSRMIEALERDTDYETETLGQIRPSSLDEG